MAFQRGFTIVEILITMAIIAVILAIAIPEVHNARVRAQAGAVIADAKAIYTAFKQYQVDHSSYYPSLSLDTFEPLRSEGKYTGNVVVLLVDGKADGYDSPDDQGANQEFWLEMTLKHDPTVRVLVADSDDAPLSGGVWLDGVFRFDSGVLTPL
jgi:prepilin-type N-terminal cleavage/methylation domain-containing protein